MEVLKDAADREKHLHHRGGGPNDSCEGSLMIDFQGLLHCASRRSGAPATSRRSHSWIQIASNFIIKPYFFFLLLLLHPSIFYLSPHPALRVVEGLEPFPEDILSPVNQPECLQTVGGRRSTRMESMQGGTRRTCEVKVGIKRRTLA